MDYSFEDAWRKATEEKVRALSELDTLIKEAGEKTGITPFYTGWNLLRRYKVHRAYKNKSNRLVRELPRRKSEIEAAFISAADGIVRTIVAQIPEMNELHIKIKENRPDSKGEIDTLASRVESFDNLLDQLKELLKSTLKREAAARPICNEILKYIDRMPIAKLTV